jgi:diguanylate cyclase (GGDEF)-like protein
MLTKIQQLLIKVFAPAFVGVVILALVVVGLLLWAASEADHIAVARQVDLAEVVVRDLQTGIAHDQESVTVWDDSVSAVRVPDNGEWLDANLGAWMQSYFGHDAAHVVDPLDQPIFSSGSGSSSTAFASVEPAFVPLAQSLRRRLAAGDEGGIGGRILSPGASDIAVVSNRPAVVSVKPIVSDTGDIEQEPGSEYLHVAVRYLDGNFLTDLENTYLFGGVRFSWTSSTDEGEEALVLRNAEGAPVGHLVWRPYLPGTAMLDRVRAPFLAVFTLLFASFLAVLFQLERRSRLLRDRDERMQYMALHDNLTGLSNRVAFAESLDQALLSARPDRAVAVLYLDLDHFKEVNDTLGHPAGDELIKQFAARLAEVTNGATCLARLGGDEFTVLAQNVAGIEEVEMLAASIVDKMRHPFDIDGNSVFIGVTIGMAIAPFDGVDRNEVTRKADIALYHAKATGRSRYALYGSAMDAVLHTRRSMERDLRSALADERDLEVHYQPLYGAKSRLITGVEALLRWRHPENGWVAPDVFIPLAEETGLIEKLGEFVLKQACAAVSQWPGLSMAVNVSAVELRNPAYATKVAARLLASELDPRRLELEVTESALTDASGICETNVRALRDIGVRVALDDFGTGFSSLSRLQHLEVDRIKIDRSFIKGFGGSNGDESIVKTILELARLRGLKTTAEGVESFDQRDTLSQMGCDDLQGFLFSRAVPAEEIGALLRHPDGAIRHRHGVKRTSADLQAKVL